jgi:hypothetical protein
MLDVLDILSPHRPFEFVAVVVTGRPLVWAGMTNQTLTWDGLTNQTLTWDGLTNQALAWAGEVL